mmetsp:Transcript_4883/g.15770  ORF Transcript_4883/g.15770 Transcript_4883/m.15770 type:complete len:330 (+) Transcript_4883:1072-2061(+)
MSNERIHRRVLDGARHHPHDASVLVPLDRTHNVLSAAKSTARDDVPVLPKAREEGVVRRVKQVGVRGRPRNRAKEPPAGTQLLAAQWVRVPRRGKEGGRRVADRRQHRLVNLTGCRLLTRRRLPIHLQVGKVQAHVVLVVGNRHLGNRFQLPRRRRSVKPPANSTSAGNSSVPRRRNLPRLLGTFHTRPASEDPAKRLANLAHLRWLLALFGSRCFRFRVSVSVQRQLAPVRPSLSAYAGYHHLTRRRVMPLQCKQLHINTSQATLQPRILILAHYVCSTLLRPHLQLAQVSNDQHLCNLQLLNLRGSLLRRQCRGNDKWRGGSSCTGR